MTDFQDGVYDGFLVILDLNDFSYFFNLYVAQISPTKSQVNWRFILLSLKSIGVSVQEKFKIDFQDVGHDGHLGFGIIDLQDTLIFSYQPLE